MLASLQPDRLELLSETTKDGQVFVDGMVEEAEGDWSTPYGLQLAVTVCVLGAAVLLGCSLDSVMRRCGFERGNEPPRGWVHQCHARGCGYRVALGDWVGDLLRYPI